MNIVTFTELRNQLNEILDQSAEQHEPIVVKRQKKEAMVILSLKDFESITETMYLLSDATNAAHLRRSIQSMNSGNTLHKSLFEE